MNKIDRTTLIGRIGLTLLVPLIVAAAADPRLGPWAVYLLALKSALQDIGMLFARDDKISDQDAGARVLDPITGTYIDRSAIDAADRELGGR